MSPKWIVAWINKSKLKLLTKTERLFLKTEISKYELSIGSLKYVYEN